jgi:putative addiction module CopG family antidote
MSYAFPPDLQRLIDSRMSSGQYHSADDLLRDALRALGEENEDLTAVREAIAEWRAGDAGTPLAEAFDEIRRSANPTGGQ